jgi:hypothetical protein
MCPIVKITSHKGDTKYYIDLVMPILLMNAKTLFTLELLSQSMSHKEFSIWKM